jgi:uncharacterized membrane-anchored protein
VTALQKGLIVAAVQMLLVASVGAKFLIDRASYPRVWVETAPIDPDLPIRGRYVRLGILVDAERHGTAEDFGGVNMFSARLEVRDDKLVAVEDQDGKHFAHSLSCESRECWRLYEPLAYFIPEHVEDPSRRPADEKLWVEVTVPPKGAPRPIQLGVKKDGALTPLQLR